MVANTTALKESVGVDEYVQYVCRIHSHWRSSGRLRACQLRSLVTTSSTSPVAQPKQRVIRLSAYAILLALIMLVLFVLPAKFGRDSTDAGSLVS